MVAENERILAQLGSIAARIVRPLDFVHDDHVAIPPMGPSEIRRFAAHPQFEAPINGLLSEKLGLRDLSLTPLVRAAANNEADSETVLALLFADMPALLELARRCAAIQLFPQIRNCILKAHRKRTEMIIGQSAFFASLRGAGTFYRYLPERSGNLTLDDVLTACVPTEEGIDEMGGNRTCSSEPIHPIVWEGMSSLLAYIRKVNASCARLFALRLPKPAMMHKADVLEMSDAQFAEMRLFLRREQIKWQS